MDESLNSIMPAEDDLPYDMRDILELVFDSGHPGEPREVLGRTTRITALPGWTGTLVGVVANQPAVLSGSLDPGSSEKISRFIRICDMFNIPLVTFVDCPAAFQVSTRSTAG